MLTGASRALILSLLGVCIFPGQGVAKPNYGTNHHWDLLGDFVYMRRQMIQNHSLVKDADKFQCPGACPDFTVIDDSDLVNRLGFEPGYRAALTYTPNARMSYEGNFLYIVPWSSAKSVSGDESLYVFSDATFDFDFTGASHARAKYETHFWDAELNYWYHLTPRRVDYFSFSTIAGLRYFQLRESFKLTMTNPPDKSSYDVHTHNHFGGIQVGIDLAWNPLRYFSWELIAKTGVMVDRASQRTFLGDLDNTVTLRHFEKQKWQVGFFDDLAIQFAFYIKNHFNIHAGYQMIYFSGVAFAPDQVVKKTEHSGHRIDTSGSGIIHGLYVGMIFSF